MSSVRDRHTDGAAAGPAAPPGRRLTFVGVIGELLITLGVVLALFIVWQNWWTDAVNTKVVKQERSAVLDDWGASMGPDGIIGPVTPKSSKPNRSATPLGSATGSAQPQSFRWAAPTTDAARPPWPLGGTGSWLLPGLHTASAGDAVHLPAGYGGFRAAAVGAALRTSGGFIGAGPAESVLVPAGRAPLPVPQNTKAPANSPGQKNKGKASQKHGTLKKPKKVQTIGFMYAPALRKKRLWATPIVQGTSDRALARGVGHYQGSASFGGIGNAAVAGHRTTHGAPFRHIDKLKRGDHIVVRIRDWWFVYVLDRSTIVRPKEHWVLKARPYKVNSGRLITLTSCHPLHSASRRFVWWGHLVRKLPATGAPPAELKMRR